MNKMELIEALAKKDGLTKSQSERVVNSLISIITAELCSGGFVKLVGFGTFDRRKYKERNGRNPQTGESLVIPARFYAKFVPGLNLRLAVAHVGVDKATSVKP